MLRDFIEIGLNLLLGWLILVFVLFLGVVALGFYWGTP